MKLKIAGLLVIAVAVLAAPAAFAADPPRFQVDPYWPKPLPNNWIMGQAAGVAVDAEDNVWVVQRPGSLTEDEMAAAGDPPRTKCCVPAPPVLKFDKEGNLLASWGGPGEGYDWPGREHGITIDDDGFVWIGGNADTDRFYLKFTQAGEFVLQIGRAEAGVDSADTALLGRPADAAVDTEANEVYIADGYGNRRVIVFDSETGAYKRHWGAYGEVPTDNPLPDYDPSAPASREFGSPVHCVVLSEDDLAYVCDRENDRIQVFQKDGSFVEEFFIEKQTLQNGSVWDLDLTRDDAETYLLNADGANNEIRTIRREDGEIVGAFGRSGRNAGDFHWVHNLAVDSEGTLYTTEVDTGKRAQRFVAADAASSGQPQ